VSARSQDPDLTLKKRPAQRRSRETFEAIVTACTGLLAERGYAGTTTNHIAERAGVNIASLYEYFPGKDAIIGQVAERLVERVMARLGEGMATVVRSDPDEAVRLWIDLIYEIVAAEGPLVATFVYQIPYANRLPSLEGLGGELLAFSHSIREHAGRFVAPDFSPAAMHLVINLVTSTILQLVLTPPEDVDREALLDELSSRIETWIRGDARDGARA